MHLGALLPALTTHLVLEWRVVPVVRHAGLTNLMCHSRVVSGGRVTDGAGRGTIRTTRGARDALAADALRQSTT